MAENPIKGEDIYDLKSIKATADQIEALLLKQNSLLKENAAFLLKSITAITEASLENVKALMKEETAVDNLSKELDENTKANEELLKIKAQLEKSSDKEVKGRLKLQKVMKAQRDILKDQIILQDREAGTLEKLNAQNRILRRERAALNLETEKGRQRLLAINDALDKNNKFIKENSDQLKKQRLNVGNYKESVKEALEETGLFDTKLGGLAQGFQRARGATLKIIRSLKTLKGALAATGIGAIALALLALFKAFTANEEGAQKLQKIMAVVSATIAVLVGRVIKAGKALVSFGAAIKAAFSFDFTKAGEEAGKAVDGIGEAFSGLFDEITKQVEGQLELVQAQQDLTKSSRTLRVAIANLSKTEESQRAIADDMTRSFAEREEAAEKAMFASTARAALQRKLAQEEFDNLTARLELAKQVDQVTSDLLDEQVTLREELIEAEKEVLLVQIENEKQRDELIQDRLERDLDFLLDIFDNQKTINERIIADETKTFGLRQALLLETRRLGNKSFDEQVEIIEEFAGQSLDFNSLIAESDAKVVQQRIRLFGLSEIVEGRALEIIRDRKTEIQDLAEAEADLAESRRNQIAENLAEEVATTKAFTDQALKEREIALLNQGKTAEEIATDLSETRIALLTNEAMILQQLGEDTTDQELEVARLRVAADKEANDKIIEQRKELATFIKEQSFKLVSDIADTQANISEQTRENDLQQESEALDEKTALIESQLQAGLISEDEARLQRESAENEFREKEKEIQRSQARADKQNAIFQATIQGFRAAVEAAPNPLKIAASVLFTAAQIGLLAATPLPTFKQGGIFDPETGLIGGSSHAAGGTTFYDKFGRPQFNAEKGEVLSIINKKSVPFYDWMNQQDGDDIPDMYGAEMLTAVRDKNVNIKNAPRFADMIGRSTAMHMSNSKYHDKRYG